MNIQVPQPPEPLTSQEQKLVLAKSAPPEPQIVYLLLAALTSIVGFIFALVYVVKDGAANKVFGIKALLAALVLPVVVSGIILVIQLQQKNVRLPQQQQPGVLLPQ